MEMVRKRQSSAHMATILLFIFSVGFLNESPLFKFVFVQKGDHPKELRLFLSKKAVPDLHFSHRSIKTLVSR